VQEFTSTASELNVLVAELGRAKYAKDARAAASLQSSIASLQQKLTLLGQQYLPLTFKFQTSDGHTYPAFSGNAIVSGFTPMLFAEGGLPVGLTYGDVVFDVPSKGGVIRMTDPFSTAVGRWTVPPTPSPTTMSTVPIGHAVHISDSHGLIADVTVENVNYTTSGDGGAPPPLNGFYAVAHVLISTPSAITPAIGSTASAQAFNNTQAELNIALANLARAKSANDTKAILGSEALVNLFQQQLALLAQQAMPFEFKYQTSDGRTYVASSGNALVSGFDPMLLGASGLPKGLTYGNVVFDVPLKGGVIELTDPLSSVIEQWTLPPA
jgi:hypothetical protein